MPLGLLDLFGAAGRAIPAEAGTYTVNLTVTDNEGATGTSSKDVTVTDSTEPPANITLTGERTNRGRTVTLRWSGASGNSVDVYINGSLNGPTANTGGQAIASINVAAIPLKFAKLIQETAVQAHLYCRRRT